MSNYSAEKLYELLPAVYRLKDAGHGYPLRDLVEVIAEQATVLELDIVRLYENWFIETCDSWVVPYIGDLIGVRGTHPANYSRRAEVANTISYRRRKGTAAVLEQLARDGAGWPARVVEFFELLSTTQHLNHLRPHNLRTPDLRRADMLELLDGPFDTIAHTAEVRRIVERRASTTSPTSACSYGGSPPTPWKPSPPIGLAPADGPIPSASWAGTSPCSTIPSPRPAPPISPRRSMSRRRSAAAPCITERSFTTERV